MWNASIKKYIIDRSNYKKCSAEEILTGIDSPNWDLVKVKRILDSNK